MKKKIDWNKIITERNERWNSASREEKKIIICKEVISMINQPWLNVEQGTYCQVEDDNTKDVIMGLDQDDLQKNLINGQIECTACARGSMMLAKFMFANPVDKSIISGGQDDTLIALEEVFTDSEQCEIESIFEACYDDVDEVHNFGGRLSNEEIFKNAERFSKNPSKRLTQIMERIINCKGDVHKALTCDPKAKIKFPVE